MSGDTRTFQDIKAIYNKIDNAEGTCIEKYNTWAENYDQDLAVLEYRGPRLVAELVAKHLVCNREKMEVLDVACGTGLGAKEMQSLGFKRFVGIDGSEGMLEMAKQRKLYQRLLCVVMGEEPVPADLDSSFDVVTVIGAFGRNHLSASSIRDICKFSKQGGYICLTVKNRMDNQEYIEAMELELKQMEDEGLWRCVEVVEEKKMRREEDKEDGAFVPYNLFLYQRM